MHLLARFSRAHDALFGLLENGAYFPELQGDLRTRTQLAALRQAHRTFTTQLETFKRYQTGGGSPASSRCGPSIAATPRNKGPDLRQHRQHRLHDPCLFSDPSQDGLIGSRPMIFSTCAHPDHSRPCAAFTGCQSRRDTRRHTYRFFPVALAVLPRTTFAAAVGFDALAGSAERAAAALVRRTPG
jgi:hypothetical protein